MKVHCDVFQTTVTNEEGREIDGVCVTCSRCGNSVEVYGTEEPSIKRGFCELKGSCPEQGNYFYTEDESSESPEERSRRKQNRGKVVKRTIVPSPETAALFSRITKPAISPAPAGSTPTDGTELPKRKRRTKAEMEADRAAAERATAAAIETPASAAATPPAVATPPARPTPPRVNTFQELLDAWKKLKS